MRYTVSLKISVLNNFRDSPAVKETKFMPWLSSFGCLGKIEILSTNVGREGGDMLRSAMNSLGKP
jgi:hypothetical protein